MKRTVLAGAALITAGVLAGLYGFDRLAGNQDRPQACAPAIATARGLDPMINGEVAAFQAAREPQDLGGLTFTGPDGKPQTVRDHEGQVVLLNLWATWCAPCRREMPALDRLQAAAGGRDFAVVPVSIDTGDLSKPKAFLESTGVKTLPLNTDPSTNIFNALKKRSLALGLPATMLIDRHGCLIGHMNGPAEWDSPDARRVIDAAVAAQPQTPG